MNVSHEPGELRHSARHRASRDILEDRIAMLQERFGAELLVEWAVRGHIPETTRDVFRSDGSLVTELEKQLSVSGGVPQLEVFRDIIERRLGFSLHITLPFGRRLKLPKWVTVEEVKRHLVRR